MGLCLSSGEGISTGCIILCHSPGLSPSWLFWSVWADRSVSPPPIALSPLFKFVYLGTVSSGIVCVRVWKRSRQHYSECLHSRTPTGLSPFLEETKNTALLLQFPSLFFAHLFRDVNRCGAANSHLASSHANKEVFFSEEDNRLSLHEGHSIHACTVA